MTSQDDLSLLKQMYQRGEITDEQYDVLRRHVLWGTPLPQLIDEVPRPAPAPAVPPPGYPGPAAPRTAYDRPGDPGRPGPRETDRPAGNGPPAAPAATGIPEPRGRRARREARSGDADDYSPSAYLPPVPTAPPAEPASHRQAAPDAPSDYVLPAQPGSRRARREAAAPDQPPAYPPPAPARAGSWRTTDPTDSPAEPASRHARREATAEQPAAYPPPVGPGSRPARPEAAPGEALRYPPPPDPPARREPDLGDPRAYLPPVEPDSRRARREAVSDDRGAYQPSTQLPPVPPNYPPPAHPPAHPPAYPPTFPPAEPGARAGDPAQSRSGGVHEYGSPVDRRQDQPSTAYAPEPAPYPPATEPAPWPGRRDDGRPGRGRTAGGEHGAARPAPRRRRRSLVAVLTSVVLALALVAAGVYWFALRQNGVPPADYARSVCGSVRDWQQQVDSRSSSLVGSVAQQPDKAVVRTSLTTVYTDLAGRTDQLRTAVLGAGVADVSGGQAYADSLAAAVGDQATALRGLSDRAAKLDPAAPATFQIQLQSLLTGPQTAVSEVSTALARPAAGTPAGLRTALSDEPACAPYVG